MFTCVRPRRARGETPANSPKTRLLRVRGGVIRGFVKRRGLERALPPRQRVELGELFGRDGALTPVRSWVPSHRGARHLGVFDFQQARDKIKSDDRTPQLCVFRTQPPGVRVRVSLSSTLVEETPAALRHQSAVECGGRLLAPWGCQKNPFPTFGNSKLKTWVDMKSETPPFVSRASPRL